MSESNDNLRFTLIEVGIVAFVIAVLAMIIVPSFMRKVKERKTTEATENIRELYNASVDHFQSQLEGGQMDPDEITFPESMDEPHPAEIGKQAVTTSDWHMIPAFRELSFGLSEPHYYQYQYESSGSGQNARFTVSAFGDLDGDGEKSRYQVEGYVDNWEVRGENIVVDRYE
jgi:type II secretory pathway pseudopilin PulG